MDNYQASSKQFIFETYRFDLMNLKAHFYYSLRDTTVNGKIEAFEEVIDFDDGNFDLRSDLDFEVLENILFHLHIALGISYYKLYPTEKLIIKSGYIQESDLEFWKKFYINGLGEFLFTNKISPAGKFHFICESDKQIIKKDFPVSEKALVPVGGGKDSIVSLELLKKMNIDYDTFVFGKIDPIKQKCIEVTQKNNLLVTRTLSNNLFTLNKTGKYFNGHVPITGIIAFVMKVAAYLYDYKYLVLSNEISANFGNTLWEGVEINHQWSKSLEFEKDFQKYCDKYISQEIAYFSLLRGMYEIKIAKLFSQYGGKYLENFSSCNHNFKIQEDIEHSGLWCRVCPKCCFVYAMLDPYFSHEQMEKIFSGNLYENKQLETLFRELLGISGIKPFECVGTNQEVIFAMSQSLKKYETLPYILQIFYDEVFVKMTQKELDDLEKKLFHISDDDIIPEMMKKQLTNLV